MVMLLSQNSNIQQPDFFDIFQNKMHLNKLINWELIKTDKNMHIYNYKHSKINIPAIKVEVVDSVNLFFLKKAITDVENHINFMQDSYLIISDSLNNGRNAFYHYENIPFYDTYQYLDLPFIADRHYIARCNILENKKLIRINWKLLKYENYSSYLDNLKCNKKSCIFIENGFGYWELEKIDNFKTKITYCIYLNPKGWIPPFIINLSNINVIPNTVVNMINEAKRLQNLN